MKVKYTQDITDPVYQDALAIRKNVFINEQGVALKREVDSDEKNTIHFVLYDETNTPLATVRLLPSANQVKVQRMAVLKEERKKGYGRLLMQAIEKYARKSHFDKIALGAQLTAQNFYQKLGYQPEGEVFIDADIKHISMVKDIS